MTDHHENTAFCCSRRTVLGVAGVAGAGAVGLGGCAAAEDAAKDVASSATDAATSAAKKAIDKSTIPVGGGTILADQKVVVTQPTAGQFKAFDATCTHKGCVVSSVADGTITCACHGSTFDAATGAVKTGPATKPLAAKSVTLGADGITVT